MSRSYADFVIPLMKSLRDDIMTEYGKSAHNFKDDRTVVTEVDVAVEKRLVESLRKKFPGIGVKGEELGEQGSSDRYWVIDPIDGTECYLRGLPGVTTIVGLVEDGVATQSYIYDPVDDVMYSAFKGEGAYVDGKKARISKRPKERAFLAISSNTKLIEVEKAMIEAGVFYTSKYYGRGMKSVYFAAGKIEGILILSARGGQWDILPSILLAEEAGAIMTSFDGGGLDTRSYALLSPTINDEVVKVIKGSLRD